MPAGAKVFGLHGGPAVVAVDPLRQVRADVVDQRSVKSRGDAVGYEVLVVEPFLASRLAPAEQSQMPDGIKRPMPKISSQKANQARDVVRVDCRARPAISPRDSCPAARGGLAGASSASRRE